MHSATDREEEIQPSDAFGLSTIELSDEVIAQVDDWAARRHLTRAEALRRLVEMALKAKGK